MAASAADVIRLPVTTIIRCVVFTALTVACGKPRQTADSEFDTTVRRPAYLSEHPKVLFDEAHHNIHTARGTYKPFVKLISGDGYEIRSGNEPFSAPALEGYTVLVIANALGPDKSPDSPAFTAAERDAVRQWVEKGGSLLLIADHAPTGGAVADLSARFGVEMSKGLVEDSLNYDSRSGDTSQLLFTRENGLLAEHAITEGRDSTERIRRVMTFTGQALRATNGGVAFLVLGRSAATRPAIVTVDTSSRDTRVTISYGDPMPASGGAQGVAIQAGKGRVVVIGEAAMLSAQLDGKTKRPFGMNVPGVDNRQLALNIMHWLSGKLR